MRSTWTRLVSLTLAALLAGGGTLAAAPTGEESRDLLSSPFDPDAVRAVDPGQLQGHHHGFERGLGESLERILVAEEEGLTRLSYTVGGETLLSSSYRRDASGDIEARLTVGQDSLELVALAGLDGTPEHLLIELNGAPAELWPAELEALAEAVASGGPPAGSPLRQPLEENLRDPAGFDYVLTDYGDFLGRLQQLALKGDLPVPSPHGSPCCLWKCFVCGSTVFAYVLQVGDLVASCSAGALITLGSMCFRSILTHMSVAGVMTGSCSRCLKCLDDCFTPVPVSGGGPGRW
jgi:hypothetical protein